MAWNYEHSRRRNHWCPPIPQFSKNNWSSNNLWPILTIFSKPISWTLLELFSAHRRYAFYHLKLVTPKGANLRWLLTPRWLPKAGYTKVATLRWLPLGGYRSGLFFSISIDIASQVLKKIPILLNQIQKSLNL